MAWLSRFRSDARGAAGLEYALLVACIGLAVVAGVALLQDEIQAGWALAADMLAS